MDFYNFKTTIYENRVGSTMNDSSVICHIYGAMENPHVFSYIFLVAKIWQKMWYFQETTPYNQFLLWSVRVFRKKYLFYNGAAVTTSV